MGICTRIGYVLIAVVLVEFWMDAERPGYNYKTRILHCIDMYIYLNGPLASLVVSVSTYKAEGQGFHFRDST